MILSQCKGRWCGHHGADTAVKVQVQRMVHVPKKTQENNDYLVLDDYSLYWLLSFSFKPNIIINSNFPSPTTTTEPHQLPLSSLSPDSQPLPTQPTSASQGQVRAAAQTTVTPKPDSRLPPPRATACVNLPSSSCSTRAPPADATSTQQRPPACASAGINIWSPRTVACSRLPSPAAWRRVADHHHRSLPLPRWRQRQPRVPSQIKSEIWLSLNPTRVLKSAWPDPLAQVQTCFTIELGSNSNSINPLQTDPLIIRVSFSGYILIVRSPIRVILEALES